MFDDLANCIYNKNMKYEWDESKREINLIKHGVDFECLVDFEWDTAVITVDDRRDYNEQRWVAAGKIDGRLHIVVYTLRSDIIRVISLRKANKREIQFYEKET